MFNDDDDDDTTRRKATIHYPKREGGRRTMISTQEYDCNRGMRENNTNQTNNLNEHATNVEAAALVARYST